MFGLVSDGSVPDMALLTASVERGEGTGPVQNGMYLPYHDKLGYLTIGTGHLVSRGITDAARRQILSDDLQLVVREAQAQDWWPIIADDDVRARALIELLFILGLPKFDGFVDTLQALRVKDWPGVAAGILDSELHRQDGVRIERLANMLLTGNDPLTIET